MSKFIPNIRTSHNVTVYVDGKPHVVAVGTAQYDLVIAALDAGDENGVRDAFNIRQHIVNTSSGRVTLEGNTLMYDGHPLHNSLTNRIISVVRGAGNAEPLLRFLENAMQNPSYRAANEQYSFLEFCDLPITDDGHFLAYKKVRSDYKDIYSGTIDHSIGAAPSMPRNMVDEDKDRTCSSGLHFCSKSYLNSYGTSNSGVRVMVVKINPRDVVAIPSDYNNSKGRACTYVVVDELTTNTGRASDTDDIPSNYSDSYSDWNDDDDEDDDWNDDDDNDDDWNDDDDDDNDDAEGFTLAPAAEPVVEETWVVTVKPGIYSLSDAQVRDIRSMISDGWSIVAIARSVGTSERTVARIRDRETYTHVK